MPFFVDVFCLFSNKQLEQSAMVGYAAMLANRLLTVCVSEGDPKGVDSLVIPVLLQ